MHSSIYLGRSRSRKEEVKLRDGCNLPLCDRLCCYVLFYVSAFSSRSGYPGALTCDQGTNLTVLTPNSFLVQRISSSPPISGVEEKEINSIEGKADRQSLALANMFWHSWYREYLLVLTVSPK